MDWFRLYSEIKDDRKVLQFPPEIRWYYVVFLCVSSEETARGNLPSVELLAISLRVKTSKVRSLITMFKKAGLIDEDATTKALTIHGWDERQRKSDDAAGRMSRLRSERKYAGCSEHVRSGSAPRVRASDTDTDTEKEIPPSPPSRGGERIDLSPPQSPVPTSPPRLSPEAQGVMEKCGRQWGAAGADVACNLLATFPAAVVAYAADETYFSDRFDRKLTTVATSFWRKTCQNHRDGPPAIRPRRPESRPAPELKFTVGTNPDDLIHPSLRGKKNVRPDADRDGRSERAQRPATATEP